MLKPGPSQLQGAGVPQLSLAQGPGTPRSLTGAQSWAVPAGAPGHLGRPGLQLARGGCGRRQGGRQEAVCTLLRRRERGSNPAPALRCGSANEGDSVPRL